MTVPSENPRNDYTGNDAVSNYGYTFRIFSKSQLKVTVRDLEDIETTLTVDVDYTVNSVGSASGSIDLIGAGAWLTAGKLKNGYKLSIRFKALLLQETDLRNQGAYFAETLEDALDLATKICQQQQDELDRSIKLPETLASGVVVLLPVPEASKMLRWNAGANGLENVDPGSVVLAVPADLSVTLGKLVDGVLAATVLGRAKMADGYVTPAKCTFDPGYSRVIGATCGNNAGTPNTQYDMDCDAVMLYNPSDGTTETRFNPGAAITNNVSTAGPAANGRDQAGAFGADSWVHFYWIWNGATLATLSSASAPPTGPTLPTGYTHWAYAGAVRFNASSQLNNTYIRGSKAFYRGLGTDVNVLTTGTATVETAVSLATAIPPNALSARLAMKMNHQDTGGNVQMNVRLVSTVPWWQFLLGSRPAADATAYVRDNAQIEIPNVGQQFYYLWGSTYTGRFMDVVVNGYTIPNGGE